MTADHTAKDRVQPSWRRTVGTMAWLALVPAWLGLAGGWFWFFDLFANFRWQYLFASVVIMAWAAWARQRRLLVLAMLTLLLNAWLVGRLAWHPDINAAVPADDYQLRVISLNVHTSNPERHAVLDYLLAADADVVFLMEVDQAWLAALSPLQAKYPHQLAQPLDNNFGVALYSRIPWHQAGLMRLGRSDKPSIQMRMTHLGRELVLIGTHPVPPMGREWSRSRNDQLLALAQHVQQIAVPVLVVGDFNATPWSVGMRQAIAGNLGYRSMAAAWHPTWGANSIFAIPIDHALATAPLLITHRRVGPDVGSDHRPLEVVVGMESRP